MASTAVRTAIRARMAAFTAAAVQYPNELATRDGNEPVAFITVQYPISRTTQLTIGSPGQNVWREEGAVRFVLNVEKNSGAEEGGGWLEEISTLFRGKSFDGVSTGAPTTPVTDDRSDEGSYFTMSISIPYQYDVVG